MPISGHAVYRPTLQLCLFFSSVRRQIFPLVSKREFTTGIHNPELSGLSRWAQVSMRKSPTSNRLAISLSAGEARRTELVICAFA